MALNKLVMKRGTFFKGYQLTVGSAAGDYVLWIDSTKPFYVCSLQFIADASGAGDYISIGHYSTTSGGKVVRALGETLYNPGAGAALSVDFPAIEPFEAKEGLNVTYTNAASIAVSMNVYVEFIR